MEDPAIPDGSKVGLDDYLAACHTPDDLFALAEPEFRPLPRQEDEGLNEKYRQSEHGIVYLRRTRDGVVETPLTNFPARIAEDITLDDGASIRQEFTVEAIVRGKRKRLSVSSQQFASMNWVSELGVGAIVSAAMGTKDHARAAIQRFSTIAVEGISLGLTA